MLMLQNTAKEIIYKYFRSSHKIQLAEETSFCCGVPFFPRTLIYDAFVITESNCADNRSKIRKN